ncbi:MAG: hypothetical protein ACSNEK_00935 [Parachlamydiaceae bacterium]
MRKKGTHTWDLYLTYHRCPQCAKIFESRVDYHYQMGKLVKELECPYCGHHYHLEKEQKQIGPLFGDPPKPEFDWS